MASTSKLSARFKHLQETPSQVNEHMQILMQYGKECRHITEFGVESVQTTYAFLMAGPDKLLSYDVNWHANMSEALHIANEAGVDLAFHIRSVTAEGFEIEPTDMLFIDTLHTENQLKRELQMHVSKVRKFIAFHDTNTFWERAEMPGERGLKYALEPFLAEHPEWKEVYKTDRNNGLTIICRS